MPEYVYHRHTQSCDCPSHPQCTYCLAEGMHGWCADCPTEEANVHTFRNVHLSTFREKMRKLAKVADKLSVPPMTWDVIGTETRTEKRGAGMNDLGEPTYFVTEEVTYVTVAVHGTSPMLSGGWRYVGCVEHMPDSAANLLHAGNGEAENVLAAFRFSPPTCDHCGKLRNRAKTIVLRDDAGTIARVGSSCVKDFAGWHGDAARIVSLFDMIRDAVREEDEDGMPYGSNYARGTDTHTFLTAVCAIVRKHGWCPKSAYSGTPTASLVPYVLGMQRVPARDEELGQMVRAVVFSPADEEEAKKVAAWARAIDAGTVGDYLGNVAVALSSDYVSSRHYGIAASAVSARAKEEAKTEARKVAAGERAASVHVGTVGKRETFGPLLVKFVRAFDNDYGTSYLVTMADDAGNVLKTFASGKFGTEASAGDIYTVKATVKAHETYEGTCQTSLSRVAIVTKHTSTVQTAHVDEDGTETF